MNDSASNIIPIVISILVGLYNWATSRKDTRESKKEVHEVKHEVDSAKKELVEVRQDLTVFFESNGHYEELLKEIIAIKRDLNDRIDRSNDQLIINADLYAKIIRYDAFFHKFYQIAKSHNKQLQEIYRKMAER